MAKKNSLIHLNFTANMENINEIFFGLVGGVGVDFDQVIYRLKTELKIAYPIIEIIRLSDFIKEIENIKNKKNRK